MAKYNQYILADMKSTIYEDFNDFLIFLKIIRTRSEDDQRIIEILIDMVSEMMSDIKEAQDLSELKSWFNLRELMEDWDDVRDNLSRDYSQDTHNLIDIISRRYEDGDDL